MAGKRNRSSLAPLSFAILFVGGFGFLLLNGLFHMPWYDWFTVNLPYWAAILNVMMIAIAGFIAITRWPIPLIARAIAFVLFILCGSLWGVSVAKAPAVSYIVMALLFVAVIVVSGLRKSDKQAAHRQE